GSWAFTLAVLVVMLNTVSLRSGSYALPDATLLAFTIAAWVPLLVRTYRPLAALVGTVVVESLHLALIPVVDPSAVETALMAAYQPVPIATAAAAYTAASRLPRPTRWVAGLVAGGLLMAVAMITRPLSLLTTDLVMLELVVNATVVGALVAGRRDRIAREADARDDETRRAVLDERLRIARELHDVVAHNITLVNAQAAVADYLLRTDPAAASVALRGISAHSARAIDELRATIGLLRDDGSPTDPAPAGDRSPVPGVDRIEELVDGFRAARADVRLSVTGDPGTLSAHGETAVYRIVAEALTNATKHAPGTPVTVGLDWMPERLEVRVRNAVPTDVGRRHRAPGTGHGLIGMRERALAAGGTFEAARHGGEFVLVATLPTAGATPPPATSPPPATTPPTEGHLR
ncbi:MAG: sensor histidine kinase, partial [Cellulomonadaceae bacterium]|nr:sensor histidine kinase [Cellulomonadaceae bacterium]